jgi:hypothetical protein
MSGTSDGGEFVAPVAPLVRGVVLAAREPLPGNGGAASPLPFGASGPAVEASDEEKLVNRASNMRAHPGRVLSRTLSAVSLVSLVSLKSLRLGVLLKVKPTTLPLFFGFYPCRLKKGMNHREVSIVFRLLAHTR